MRSRSRSRSSLTSNARVGDRTVWKTSLLGGDERSTNSFSSCLGLCGEGKESPTLTYSSSLPLLSLDALRDKDLCRAGIDLRAVCRVLAPLRTGSRAKDLSGFAEFTSILSYTSGGGGPYNTIKGINTQTTI